MKLLEACRVFVGHGQLLVARRIDGAAIFVHENLIGFVPVVAKVGYEVYQGVMQTLGEESAAHSVEVHEIRIGIYKRILAYRHLLATTERLNLNVIGNGIGGQLDDGSVAIPVIVIDGFHCLHKAVGILLCPRFAVVREHIAVFVEQYAV